MGQVRTGKRITFGFRRILGIDFYCGDVPGAVDRIRSGGLLVVPAAPALIDLATNETYREALLNADLAITDSAFMVLIWNLLRQDHVRRISGLEYLRVLLDEEDVQQPGNTVWIMASAASADRNLAWLNHKGIDVPSECVYLAPLYGSTIVDEDLIALLMEIRPQHLIIAIGGGTQERLGLYVKRNLGYLPAIHCIGAAIAFLSGDQVLIPQWADKLYLGWLFRTVSDPIRYLPRYWEARKLFTMMLRYGSEMPPLVNRDLH